MSAGGRTAFQSRFAPYHTKRMGSFAEGNSNNGVVESSPYFAAQARHTTPFRGIDLTESQQDSSFGKSSGDCRPFTHVQAAYIRSVKEWHKHKDIVELLMDVYGFLDSEIYLKDFGRKEFVLRDASDSIYVSYYEIDMPMMHVPRRNWLKVTCVWRYWGLQAVKIQEPEVGFMDNLEEKGSSINCVTLLFKS